MRRALLAIVLVGCTPDEHAPSPPATEPPFETGTSLVDAGADTQELEADAALDTESPDTRFASYPPWPDADVDAWLTGPTDAGSCDDAATDAAPGTRFCELYRDLLAHPGAARCQTYGCHGGDVGMQGLAMGWTARSMYDAMVAFTTWIEPKRLLTPLPGGDSRSVSALANAVGPTNGYFMPMVVPELGNRKLTNDEVARIEAWLARGAPFD